MLEGYRGQGWYTEIVAAQLQRAIALGRRYATLGVEPECHVLHESFGFERISSAYYLYWIGAE